jgi:hypothetical protein
VEPVSGLLLVAGAAGLSKVFSDNTDRIVNALEARVARDNPPPERIVIVERPEYDPAAAASMKLDK